MLLGLSLFYVGAVLFLNGLWMLGRIGDKEIWIVNVFSGGLTLLVSLRLALTPHADAASIRAAALNLLFRPLLNFQWVVWWVKGGRKPGAADP